MNNLILGCSTSNDDSEDKDKPVFHDDEPPPLPSILTELGNSAARLSICIGPEPEKEAPITLGRPPISRSLNDIIEVVKNSHQEELTYNNNFSVIIKTSEESMTSISNLCSAISKKLDLVIDNSSTNSTRLTAVEHRVGELDRNTKLYIDSKISSITCQPSQHPPHS